MAYARIEIDIRFGGTREEFRMNLAQTFLEEEAGTGKGEGTKRYTYRVDKTASGHHVELWRPAMLNKGIDFTVRIPSLVVSDRKKPWGHVPSHQDLIRLLKRLRRKDGVRYQAVAKAIDQAYDCKRITGLSAMRDFYSSPLGRGCQEIPADVTVLIAKWLFAEQDLTYWNQSGRKMLRDELASKGLLPLGRE